MSEKKYTFSKEIAESLGITEAIILDFLLIKKNIINKSNNAPPQLNI